MQKTFTVSETLPFSVEQVWAALEKPADLNVHNCPKRDVVSETEWVEHTNENISNKCIATVFEGEKRIEIKSENSKYKGEWDDIKISVKPADGGKAEVTIDYLTATSAVFNMLAFKAFGEKIMNYSSNTIFKHIESNCK